MHSFIRFVFSILIAGMLVNLTIVILANGQSQRRQSRQNKQNEEALGSLLENNFDRRLRRVDIVVESQRIDHSGDVTDSTLLVREYHSTGSDQSRPLRISRIEIPKDRLSIYGVILEFNTFFAEDAAEFQILRGRKMAYFGVVCGEEEKPAAQKADERFTFMPRNAVPELTRIDSTTKLPTIYEAELWKYVLDRIPDERHELPWSTNWSGSMNATFVKPATATVRLRHGYTAWISTDTADGSLSIEEDPAGTTGLTKMMMDQIKMQEAESQGMGLEPQ